MPKYKTASGKVKHAAYTKVGKKKAAAMNKKYKARKVKKRR